MTSVVELPPADIWCNANQICKDPEKFSEKDIELNVAQVWSTSRQNQIVDDIDNYRQGIKTISKNTSEASCSASSRGTYGISRHKLRQYCSFDDRLDQWSPSISSYGFVHNCDTMKGASGAPVFRQSDLDRFRKASPGDTNSTKIVLTGIHRAGKRNAGNCAVPASLATPYIIP